MKDFFQTTPFVDKEPTTRTHCSCCILSAAIPTPSDTLQSIRLTSALDIQVLRTSLLNEAIPLVHCEVTKWSATQRQALIDHLIELITILEPPSTESLSQSLFTLDGCLQVWTSSLQESLHSYTITTITKETCQDTIDLQAKELIDLAIAAKHREVDNEVMAKFDHHARWEQSLAELHTDFDNALIQEKQALAVCFEHELNEFKNDLHVRTDEAKADTEARMLTSVHRSSRCPKPFPMTLRHRKPKTSAPSDDYVPTSNSDSAMTENESDAQRSDPTLTNSTFVEVARTTAARDTASVPAIESTTDAAPLGGDREIGGTTMAMACAAYAP